MWFTNTCESLFLKKYVYIISYKMILKNFQRIEIYGLFSDHNETYARNH
jgi:hypothetical protein